MAQFPVKTVWNLLPNLKTQHETDGAVCIRKATYKPFVKNVVGGDIVTKEYGKLL